MGVRIEVRFGGWGCMGNVCRQGCRRVSQRTDLVPTQVSRGVFCVLLGVFDSLITRCPATFSK